MHACERERADLRREHTRTVERVTLGEGSRRKTKAKTKRKVGERSVSKTRDESKTEKRKKAKKERRLGQIGNRRGRLLHPPPLKTELSLLSKRVKILKKTADEHGKGKVQKRRERRSSQRWKSDGSKVFKGKQ